MRWRSSRSPPTSAPPRARHLAAGMNFCLTKPVVWPDLFAALASVASGNATPAGVMPAAAAEAAVAAPAFEPGPEDVPLLDLGLLQELARNVPAPAFRGLLDRGLAG